MRASHANGAPGATAAFARYVREATDYAGGRRIQRY